MTHSKGIQTQVLMAPKTALGQVLSQTAEKRSVWLLKKQRVLIYLSPALSQKALLTASATARPGCRVGVARSNLCAQGRLTQVDTGLQVFLLLGSEEQHTGVKGLRRPATSHQHCPPVSVLGGFGDAARISCRTFFMGMWSLGPRSATCYLISA